MVSPSMIDSVSCGPQGQFSTTHWSLVLTAYASDTATAAVALNKLCRSYWHPVYAFIRRKGHQPEEARDLTQEFFCELLEKELFLEANRERGRFRSFLLGALKNFLSHQWEKFRAKKRGGDYTFISVDAQDAEGNYPLELVDRVTPEQLFERRWALSVLEHTFEKLKSEHVSAGKGQLFEALQTCLSGETNALSYAAIGAELNMSEGAARVAAHRLRSRYAELLRGEISRTVAGPAEMEAELAALRAALTS